MNTTAFTSGQRFHFLNHPAFPVDEIFTVEKVEDGYITAQSDRPRWRDAPMIISNTALAGYDNEIEFLRPGQAVEVARRTKIHSKQTFTEGEKSDLRHLMRTADKFIEALPVGERIDFDALIESGEVIEQGEKLAA